MKPDNAIPHTVTVINHDRTTEVYQHIVAIGVGHRLPNLVLVERAPDLPEKIIELNHLHISSFHVQKTTRESDGERQR